MAKLESVDINNPYSQGFIGPLCDIKTMAIITGITQAKDQLVKISKEVGNWRSILGDGNCFYRSFMFALLENHILNNDIKSLKKIMCDIKQLKDIKFKRKDTSFKRIEILSVFLLILDELEKSKDVKRAYAILLKAYNTIQAFDYVI